MAETSNQQPDKVEIGGVELTKAEAQSILDLDMAGIEGWKVFCMLLSKRLQISYVQNSTEVKGKAFRWRQGEQVTLLSMLEVPALIRNTLKELTELGTPEQ